MQLFAGLTWLFVYRTEKYKKLKTEVDKQSKKRNRLFTLLLLLSFPVEKQRDSTDISVDRIAKKRLGNFFTSYALTSCRKTRRKIKKYQSGTLYG